MGSKKAPASVWSHGKKGKIYLTVYDAFTRTKTIKTSNYLFEQINDIQYMLDPNTLILVAKGGQKWYLCYTKSGSETGTDHHDVYDDLDATFA